MENNDEINLNLMNITNVIEKARVKIPMWIEYLYRYICPHGTHKTTSGKLKGIATTIEKFMRARDGFCYYSSCDIIKAIEGLVIGICEDKDDANMLVNGGYLVYDFITSYMNNVIRFGVENATTRLMKGAAAFGIIGKNKTVV